MSQDRWSRQISIPGFGEEGQRSLSESQVAVLGLGVWAALLPST